MVRLYVFLFCTALYGQVNNNLIDNDSFENFTTCPNNLGEYYYANFWTIKPTPNSTVDFFNSCTTNSSITIPTNNYGWQSPKTGSNYMGLYVYSNNFTVREYLEQQLVIPLKSGKSYCISYYVSLAEVSRWAISNLGVCFTSNILQNTQPFPPNDLYLTPSIENPQIIQDTLNWIKLGGVYNASGNENFITIGNFRNDNNTNLSQIKPLLSPTLAANIAYYYIDDISVVEINPAKAYPTKTITTCANTTFTLGTDSTFDATYQWQPTTGLSCTNCPNPVLIITSPKKYYLTKQQCSATTKDSVYIQIYTPTLTANAGTYKNICQNDTIKLGVNDTTAFTSYVWQPTMGLNCFNCPQPLANPFTTTTYTLNKTECSFNTSDTVTVHVETCEVIIPDIFTPNNDNVNDEWKIILPNDFKLKTVAVYNRWGTLIYNIDDSVLNTENTKIRVARWDGRTTSGLGCSDGVYFYVLHYTDKAGELQKKKGNLTLIR